MCKYHTTTVLWELGICIKKCSEIIFFLLKADHKPYYCEVMAILKKKHILIFLEYHNVFVQNTWLFNFENQGLEL